MKVLIITFGSRGDVQPFIALGRGLRSAGHCVAICTGDRFKSHIEDQGLSHVHMNDELLDFLQSQEGRETIERMSSFWATLGMIPRLMKRFGPISRAMLNDGWRAVAEFQPDIIIFHPKIIGAPHYAEKAGLPVVMIALLPQLVKTGDFPSIGFPNLNIGDWYNRATYSWVSRITRRIGRKYIDEWRAEKQLPPQRKQNNALQYQDGKPIPILHAYSEHVLPTPDDWPETAYTSGYCFLDQGRNWQAPDNLAAFLDHGPPPVYIGFGSMAGRNPKRLSAIAIAALTASGQRGIIATGWGGLNPSALPETIFKLKQAPHDWLFPQVAAVIHHGGAGTTAAGLRAGKPTLICPFFGDQPFWGRRIHQLGAGCKPIPQKRLTARKLAKAINELVNNPAYRQQAARLAAEIRQENGVVNACRLIEARLPQKSPHID